MKSAESSIDPISRHTPPFSHEDVHWMLQPSCWSTPSQPWQRVHICCFRKSKPKNTTRTKLVLYHIIGNVFDLFSKHV